MASQLTSMFPGQIGVYPGANRLSTNLTFSRITQPGYLNEVISASATPVAPSDFIFAKYSDGEGGYQSGVFYADFSPSGVISLVIPNGGGGGVISVEGVENEIEVTGGENALVGIAPNPIIPGNGAITLPSGNNSQRTAPPNGARYNTDSGLYELYYPNLTEWQPIVAGTGNVNADGNGTSGRLPMYTDAFNLINSPLSLSDGILTSSAPMNIQGTLTGANYFSQDIDSDYFGTLSDGNTTFTATNTAPITFTLLESTVSEVNNGFHFTVINDGSSTITFAVQGGDSILGATSLLTVGDKAFVEKIPGTTWSITVVSISDIGGITDVIGDELAIGATIVGTTAQVYALSNPTFTGFVTANQFIAVNEYTSSLANPVLATNGLNSITGSGFTALNVGQVISLSSYHLYIKEIVTDLLLYTYENFPGASGPYTLFYSPSGYVLDESLNRDINFIVDPTGATYAGGITSAYGAINKVDALSSTLVNIYNKVNRSDFSYAAGNSTQQGPSQYSWASEGTLSSQLPLVNNSFLNIRNFMGYDGASWIKCASEQIAVDGIVSTGIVPTSYALLLMDSFGDLFQGLALSTTGYARTKNQVIDDGSGNFSPLGSINLTSSTFLNFNGTISGTVSISAPATITTYPIYLPATQGGAGTVMVNDSSGNLTWQTFAGEGSILQGGNSFTGSDVIIGSLNDFGLTFLTNTNTVANFTNTGVFNLYNSEIITTPITLAATGTVSVMNGSNSVAGSSTLFKLQYTSGDSIVFSGDATVYTVLDVSSNTTLTLTITYPGTTASGLTAYLAQPPLTYNTPSYSSGIDSSGCFYSVESPTVVVMGVGNNTKAMYSGVSYTAVQPALLCSFVNDFSLPAMEFYRANGSKGSLSAVSTNSVLFQSSGFGYDGSDYINSGKIVLSVNGPVSSLVVPTHWNLFANDSSGFDQNVAQFGTDQSFVYAPFTVNNGSIFVNSTYGYNFNSDELNTVILQGPAAGFSSSYQLSLPIDPPVTNSYLASDSFGNMSWQTPAGAGDVLLGGNTLGSSPMVIGTLDNNPFEIIVNGEEVFSIDASGQGNVATLGRIIQSGTQKARTFIDVPTYTAELNDDNIFCDVRTIPITITLPAANDTPAIGSYNEFTIVDQYGSSNINNITITSSTMINGSYTYTITSPYGSAKFISNGITWNIADENSAGGDGDISQGGNSFGFGMIIGTLDNEDFSIKTNAITRFTISNSGGLFAFGNLTIASGDGTIYAGSGGGITVRSSTSAITPYTMYLPPVVGALNTILTTDASGNLSWANQNPILQGGNSGFGGPVVVGSNDANPLYLRVDGSNVAGFDASGNFQTDGQIWGAGTRKANTFVTPTDSPYTALISDDNIWCDTRTGAITVILPNSTTTGVNGREYKIGDQYGTASINNITLSSDNIAGAPSFIIANDWGGVLVSSNGVNAWGIF